MDTIEFVKKNDCCGCGSCVQKCPKQAISMVENEEGFLYPQINKEKCVDCGLCSKVCPQLKSLKMVDKEYPKTYAMRNRNNEDLSKSSSGGIFSVIADYVFENDGVVFGAAYDDKLNVNHIKAENQQELEALRSSKYVQSNIGETYKGAEKLLKEGRIVLFTGTPCQIAGLNSYLIKKYKNLITCDLVCHGVPSQKLFHTYIEYLSRKFNSRVVKYNFRSKDKNGWGLFTKVETEDGKIRYIKPDFDPYYSNFLESTTYRLNCYQCHYTSCNRVSNITLADYWGISGIHPDFYKEEGNSLILINDKKGEQIFEKIADKIEYIQTDLEKAANHNKNLVRPSKYSNERQKIYIGIYEKSPEQYIKENLKVKLTGKKMIKSIIPNKMQKILKKMRGMVK
ncbi:MAG TPA: Coenzyme F420 hydrogenase/dehydrogenase, beta subunit C-terminal domain [Clostridiaceae bacterium]|nr:Coenzyme F420 hydrogenase/dehydrogenase, beta subunit C-terminal domain [Clostridiaceae bacterium]